VSVFEEELAGAFVIFLIEGAAGDKDSDGHKMLKKMRSHAE
jgi:hypothetical protein